MIGLSVWPSVQVLICVIIVVIVMVSMVKFWLRLISDEHNLKTMLSRFTSKLYSSSLILGLQCSWGALSLRGMTQDQMSIVYIINKIIYLSVSQNIPVSQCWNHGWHRPRETEEMSEIYLSLSNLQCLPPPSLLLAVTPGPAGLPLAWIVPSIIWNTSV